MSALPTEEEVTGYAKTLSNWGRWGADDELGTLNLITEAKRREAMSLARVGRVVSLAWDIDSQPPGADVKLPPQRYILLRSIPTTRARLRYCLPPTKKGQPSMARCAWLKR